MVEIEGEIIGEGCRLIREQIKIIIRYDDVSGILTLGGTILGTTNKADPFHYAVKSGRLSDGKKLWKDGKCKGGSFRRGSLERELAGSRGDFSTL